MATGTLAGISQSPASPAAISPAKVKPRWIISSKTDLAWFTLGGVSASYIFWALWRYSGIPLILLVAVWGIVFDETHGFATISRTYFDSEERDRRGRWLWLSLVFFFAIGPVLIVLGLGDWLELATELWGYYHIFKQHYGFMMIYKAKNGDLNPVDNRLDKLFFAAAFYFPFLTYPLHNKYAAGMLPFPISRLAGTIFENTLLLGLILVGLMYLSRQGKKWRMGVSLNWPKQILFAAAIPVNYFLFRSAMPLIGVYAAVTIYHNIQYHRLVWFYNRNKYGGKQASAKSFGLATLINSRWLAYIGCALAYGLLFDYLPDFILKPHLGPGSRDLRNELIFSFFAAPGLLHYWIDGHIWKVRHDPDLKDYLQLKTKN
jgi:hypothetical protein